jgi:hypothetical protein
MSAQQQQPAPIPMPLQTHPQPQHFSATAAAAHPQPAHGSHAMPPVTQWSAHPPIDLTCGQDDADPNPNEQKRRPQQLPHPSVAVHAQPAPQSHHLQELTAQQMAYYSRYDSVLD